MEMSKIFNQIKAYARRHNLPIIPIWADDISIINEPNVFYEILLDKIHQAKRRVLLSALYIGVGPKESSILQTLSERLSQSSDLHLKICLDANRARRANRDGISSVSILKEVMTNENADLRLISTSDRNNLIERALGRLGELVSTYHSKFLLFDDDVILTGANLSNIYFEKRQDRYMCIKSSKLISDYIFQLVDNFQSPNLAHSLNNLNKNYIDLVSQYKQMDQDCFIMPLVQHEPSGLNQNDDFLKFINTILPDSSQIYLSSGYFNPSGTIASTRIDSVLAPCEEANGFYNGGGLLKFVPRLYTALHEKFLNNTKQCKLFLYKKLGWSFHAKGVWILGVDDLYIHLIGSSNFNHRSSHRDLETQFLIMTQNKALIKRLEDERADLWTQSEQFDAKEVPGLNFIHRTMARLLKTFL